ncbi:MAG: phosphodiester glycosidase family protein [Syntrophomonadaceae bacterium]|jgi:exopolysaccharide biosynthesis protein
MRSINRFMLFLIAPFLGLGLYLAVWNNYVVAAQLSTEGLENTLDNAIHAIDSLQENVYIIADVIAEQEEEYQRQLRTLREMSDSSLENKEMSDQIYEQRILNMLGPPIRTYLSDRTEIKIFDLNELGYRGVIAKVKLFDPSVFRVVLANDQLGTRETTAQAVARSGAILGINGGGFYSAVEDGQYVTLPLGNTVIDGKLVNGLHFAPDMFFAGITRDGDLIGEVCSNQEEFMNLDAYQGVSFLPVLIKEGQPAPIPKDWAWARQPRTLIGEYANGDLILIVVDGRQSDWSSGVTLERLQVKLIELGVKNGFNLDGGGSSTMVFQGEVLNRPSDGSQRPVVTNIIIMP